MYEEIRWEFNLSGSPVKIDCNFRLAVCLPRLEFFRILRYNNFVKIEVDFYRAGWGQPPIWV